MQLFAQFVGHFAAVLRKLHHDLLVEPNIHGRRIVLVAGKMKLPGKLFARRKAGIEIEQLHQVDDRMPPVELLLVARGKLVEN